MHAWIQNGTKTLQWFETTAKLKEVLSAIQYMTMIEREAVDKLPVNMLREKSCFEGGDRETKTHKALAMFSSFQYREINIK